jgi:hypothetical protein
MMAGFETIVRPVVFPSIRPQPARSLPPEDDSEQGFATISGSSGSLIGISYSYSVSLSRSIAAKEEKRSSDEVRVFQKEADGKINRDNYVDVKVAKNILTAVPEGEKEETIYRPAEEQDNVEIRKTDIIDYNN